MSEHDGGVSLRDFFDSRFTHLGEKVDEILLNQATASERLRKAENAIAVLMWAYGLGAVVIGWIVSHNK